MEECLLAFIASRNENGILGWRSLEKFLRKAYGCCSTILVFYEL